MGPRGGCAGAPGPYARRMRTDRELRRFYAAGWLISAGVMLVAGRMWQLHLHEVEQRAEEAERTKDEAARRRTVEERLRIAREQPAELLQALRVAVRGDSLLSPAVTRRLISEFVARPPDVLAAVGMESLTNREREVVALVARGLNNDEIAEAMVLSPATAKTHVSRAMIKLGARDRAQLVVFAYQSGLVSPRELSPPR
jgi:DNA-binding CsgD family transcriptional regulator